MSSASALRLTYQDYLALPEDHRYEIIDGDLFMTPAPATYHQIISQNLEFVLFGHVRQRQLGKVLHAPCDVVLSQTDVVQPDVLFVAKERLSIIAENYVSGAPDLIVEILSKGSAKRDRTLKKELYARSGVRELWIVDPSAKTVEILRNAGGRFESRATFSESDVLRTDFFPGLDIPLAEVF